MYWLSTKSHPNLLDSLPYETPELAALLRSGQGVDAAILAQEAHVSAPCIRAYQRKLGTRPISNPRQERTRKATHL